MFFLYAESIMPCITPNSEFESHLKFREESQSMPKQYSSNRSRGGPRQREITGMVAEPLPQNVVINQNHYHIEQMNVNNYEESTQQSDKNSTKRKEITSMTAVRKHHKELKEGIVGLKNNSLYCYMNACLQCLSPISELRDYYIN